MNEPLTIALVTPRYPPLEVASGIATYVYTLAHALAARGHTVHVLTRWAGEDEVEEGVITVHRLGPKGVSVPAKLSAANLAKFIVSELLNAWRYRRKLAAKLNDLLEREQLDLIEVTASEAETLFFEPDKHKHVPLVVRLQGPVSVWELFERSVPEALRRLVRFFERRQLLKASHITAPGSAFAQLCRSELALSAPIDIIPNPLSVAKEPARESLEDTVLFVGRIVHGKGVDVLIRAVPAVLERFPKTKFVFVGSYSTTVQGYDSIKDYLHSLLPLEQRGALHFEGYKAPQEVAAYYRSATVCVFPSRFEPFGYTCVEAMGFSKAIIGSNAGGMAESLAGGRCGLLYTPPDSAELAAHIVRLLGEPELRETLGHAARERAVNHYAEDAVAAQMEAFYRRAIAEKTSALR